MKEAFLQNMRDLIEPIAGKPALASALTVIAVYASLDAPFYAPFLLFPVAVAVHFFPRSVQWCTLGTLVIACACHAMFGGPQAGAIGNTGGKDSPEQELPTESCGTIEALLPRANGTAFIIQIGHEANASTNSGKARVRLTEKRDLPGLPEPGDSICYEAKWYPVNDPTVPGAFNTREWLRSQGFAAYGKFVHWKAWKGKWIPEKSFYAFRRWIKGRFEEHLEPAETGLLLGLLAGDRSGIPEALRNDFQRSGLVHVLAISGFHVVLLAGMLMVFLKATRLPHKAASIIAIILLAVYVPVTGGSPAVQRAVLMFAVPQVGLLFERPANTLNSLGVALLFILLPSPHELWNTGFQLSAAATAGILIGNAYNPLKHIPDFLKHSKIWNFFESFAISPTYVTLCATLATSPFLIHHFKTLSPFAWLGNIVVVPAISWGMQAGLFALLSPIDFMRETFCNAASFFLRLASLLTRQLSDSAQASVTVGPLGPSILLLLTSLFLMFPLYRKNAVARFFCAFCLLAFSGIFCYQGYERIFNPTWSMTVIDVGQGDSILLRTPGNRYILVDAGDKDRNDSGKDIIVPFLHHIGVQRLDALVITHPHKDHFGGAASLLRTFPVKEVWTNECSNSTEGFEWMNVLDEAGERNVPVHSIRRGFLWKENFFELQAVHPKSLGNREKECRDLNDGSITLRASGFGRSALVTGDLTIAGEKEILNSTAYIKSDILKLGHHGSKTSSSAPFLTAVAPELAIISSGRRNRFRHPHKQVTNRLDSLRIPYLNTAKNGTVTVTFSADTIVVETMLE
ncbi:MAG: DNA internalization-related competence protein ComEC/Rec2 [Fibrobacter sp.]|nr:DNA internalization-related competence protein ComEC/Rec2 [Fibrobacter sp.]